MAACDLTAARLRELLDYDPETGAFTRLLTTSSRARAGSQAGCLDKLKGYLRFNIGGRLYYAHRLAWLYVYGEMPQLHIDHINGNRADNRIVNLRDVPPKLNAQNRQRANMGSLSKILGVSENAGQKRTTWSAHISIDGRRVRLGTFRVQQEAVDAFIAAKREFHPGSTL